LEVEYEAIPLAVVNDTDSATVIGSPLSSNRRVSNGCASSVPSRMYSK
jgi:hypothetical protein